MPSACKYHVHGQCAGQTAQAVRAAFTSAGLPLLLLICRREVPALVQGDC